MYLPLFQFIFVRSFLIIVIQNWLIKFKLL